MISPLIALSLARVRVMQHQFDTAVDLMSIPARALRPAFVTSSCREEEEYPRACAAPWFDCL
jgi:hypothetical protein